MFTKNHIFSKQFLNDQSNTLNALKSMRCHQPRPKNISHCAFCTDGNSDISFQNKNSQKVRTLAKDHFISSKKQIVRLF